MINIEVKASENEKVANIIVQGDVTLRWVGEIKAPLIDALKKYQEFKINFVNMTALDLAGVQTIIALKKSAKQEQKKITTLAELDENTEQLLINNGFSKLFDQEKE